MIDFLSLLVAVSLVGAHTTVAIQNKLWRMIPTQNIAQGPQLFLCICHVVGCSDRHRPICGAEDDPAVLWLCPLEYREKQAIKSEDKLVDL